MSVYHVSNWGKFGVNIPSDRDGYARTSIRDVLAGDYGFRMTKDDAAELAEETRKAIAKADKKLDRWRSGKG